jgi:prepilin-type N-terminal cleavage/methylation domain-containing protein
MRARRVPRVRSGFSMIELLVVLMIGGMMAKLSISRIHTLMTQQRVIHAATAVQNDLEAAFQIAGRNRKPVQIVWDTTAKQFLIADRTGTMYYRKTNLSQQAYGFRRGAVTVSHDTVEVYPNGFAASTLLITLSSNGYTKSLLMSRAGLVRIQ